MGRITSYIKRGLRYIISGTPIVVVQAKISYLNPSNLLKGKKILITGGNNGIGKAMALEFKKQGAMIVIAGRNRLSLQTAANEIGCEWIELDISDLEMHERAIKLANEKIGGLNVLVNNAGISYHEQNIYNVTPEGFDAQFSCNLRGNYFLTKSFLKNTNDKENRNILFVSSERSIQADDIPYGLTKAAMNSLVKGLAYRVISDKVRINAVAPGVTASAMTGVAKDGNLYYPANSNNRAYLPEEVAQVAIFLLSDYSSCVSGQIIFCNEAKTVNAHWKKNG